MSSKSLYILHWIIILLHLKSFCNSISFPLVSDIPPLRYPTRVSRPPLGSFFQTVLITLLRSICLTKVFQTLIRLFWLRWTRSLFLASFMKLFRILCGYLQWRLKWMPFNIIGLGILFFCQKGSELLIVNGCSVWSIWRMVQWTDIKLVLLLKALLRLQAKILVPHLPRLPN